MILHILREKNTKKFIGYTDSAFPISTENPNWEYIRMDLNQDDYDKILRGWRIDTNDKLFEPDHVKLEKQKQQTVVGLKDKLKNDMATLDDIKTLLKLTL